MLISTCTHNNPSHATLIHIQLVNSQEVWFVPFLHSPLWACTPRVVISQAAWFVNFLHSPLWACTLQVVIIQAAWCVPFCTHHVNVHTTSIEPFKQAAPIALGRGTRGDDGCLQLLEVAHQTQQLDFFEVRKAQSKMWMAQVSQEKIRSLD